MIAIERDVLKDALAVVRPFIANRAILPVLECVRLTGNNPMSDEGYITLQGTDLEQSIELRVPANVGAEMDVCLPMKLLSDFVATLPAEKIHLAATEHSVSLECMGHKARIKHLDAADFPQFTPVDADAVEVDADELRRAIELGAYAAARDVSRPTLTAGVLFLEPLLVVSADGFRLAVSAEGYYSAPEDGVLVMAKTLHAVARVAETTCAVRHDDNHIQFETDTATITSLLVNGKFPDYTAIIPKEHTVTVKVDRVGLLGAVNLAMLFARDSANVVRFTSDEMRLTVKGAAAESGDGVTVLPAAITGESFEWAVNGVYLRQVLEAFECDEVVLELQSVARPVVVKGDALAVIMPMHIDG